MAGENKTEVTVKSDLLRIVDDLKKIEEAQKKVTEGFKKNAEALGGTTNEQAKRVEIALDKMRGFGRRVADQLKSDFRSMLSIGALGEGMKLGDQFRGSVKETITLSDTIRKVGGVLGIVRKDFADFQSQITKGMGEIGLSSESAARSMEGLSQSGTPVSGRTAVSAYASQAGMLASTTRNQGREGDIARLMAQVIQARGGNVNDTKQLGAVAEDVRRVFNATGTGAEQTLNAMKSLFTTMSSDFRKSISTRGLANLAATAQTAGPNSTKFLEEFLGKSPIARKAMEAQGFRGVVGNNGLDVEKFRSASKEVLGRIGMDPRKAAQTLGLSEEAAEGFIRLAESLDRVKSAQEAVNTATGDLEGQYRNSQSMSEAFKASINRVKAMVAAPLSSVTQGGTDLLSKASQSDAGSAGVVAGGAALAAMLAGAGLRGVGGGLLGGAAKGAVAKEAGITPVYVTNYAEFGGPGGKLASVLGESSSGSREIEMGGAAAAGGAGIMQKLGVAAVVGPLLAEGATAAVDGRLAEALDKLTAWLTGGDKQKPISIPLPAVAVKVELKSKELKSASMPGRGGGN